MEYVELVNGGVVFGRLEVAFSDQAADVRDGYVTPEQAARDYGLEKDIAA